MHAEVECQVEILRAAIVRAKAEALRGVLHVGDSVRLADGYAFGDSGAARGEEQVGGGITSGIGFGGIGDLREVVRLDDAMFDERRCCRFPTGIGEDDCERLIELREQGIEHSRALLADDQCTAA